MDTCYIPINIQYTMYILHTYHLYCIFSRVAFRISYKGSCEIIGRLFGWGGGGGGGDEITAGFVKF